MKQKKRYKGIYLNFKPEVFARLEKRLDDERKKTGLDDLRLSQVVKRMIERGLTDDAR